MNSAPGTDFLNSLASSLSSLLAGGLTQVFGPALSRPLFGQFTRLDLAVMGCLLAGVLVVNALVAFFLIQKKKNAAAESKNWLQQTLHALGKPVYLLIWIYGIYLVATPALMKWPNDPQLQPVRKTIDLVLGLEIFVMLFWLFIRFTRVLEAWLMSLAEKTESKLDDLVVPLIGKSLRVIAPVIGIIFALPVLGLPPEFSGVLTKASSILIIGTVAWVLFQGVGLGEKAVLARFDIKAVDNLRARTVYTQVHVLSKTLYAVISIFSVASVLMLFQEVRHFGTSILASAGIVGIIVGFAAQKTISNMFAGFQLAMAQPIRLDDVVVLENEYGRVEEITLTYVVIHLWDDRRLIVPLSYFIEKPFQNWTRSSANLLSSVAVWTDYSMPVDEVRKAVKGILENHPLWDKRFWNVQVNDATEHTMQLRVLVTASDSGKSSDLRADVREKLIAYIAKNHPQCLPKTRQAAERLPAVDSAGNAQPASQVVQRQP